MVVVSFNIPKDVIIASVNRSRSNHQLSNVQDIDSICITGSFDNWQHEKYFMVYDNINDSYKVSVFIPESVRKNVEFKIVVDHDLWITLDAFPTTQGNGYDSNNLLDINAQMPVNPYYKIIDHHPVSPEDDTMVDVILESVYSSEVVTEPESQVSLNISEFDNPDEVYIQDSNIKNKHSIGRESNTVIALDTYKLSRSKLTKNPDSSNKSNSSQSDDVSVYRYENLELKDHYLEDDHEGYANIMRDLDVDDDDAELALDSSFISNTTQNAKYKQKNKVHEYLIPRQLENGSFHSSSITTLANNMTLFKTNSSASLSAQATNKYTLGKSPSNKMKIKALMKSFFWKE